MSRNPIPRPMRDLAPFTVEATVNAYLPIATAVTDRQAVAKVLAGLWDRHDPDFTVKMDGAYTARVQKALRLDLARVRGATLAEQLQALHALAREELAEVTG